MAAASSVASSVANPWYTHLVNQESVVDTLEFIRSHQLPIKKFLFSSSAAVYGDTTDYPTKEDSHINPMTPCAIDKYAAERYTVDYGRLYGIPTVAVRFFNVYGPRQNPNSEYSGVLSIITECLRNNGKFTLYGDGCQTRDYIYIRDVVNALIKVATKDGKSTVYNISNGDETSLIDIIHVYEDIVGHKLNVTRGQAR